MDNNNQDIYNALAAALVEAWGPTTPIEQVVEYSTATLAVIDEINLDQLAEALADEYIRCCDPAHEAYGG